MMRQSRLRWYIVLSLLLHVLIVWLLRFLPVYESEPLEPVAIRVLEVPSKAPAGSTPPPRVARQVVPPKEAPPKPEAPKPKPPAPPKQGGHLADIPKPVRQERPEDARIVSRYDSKAQDVGPEDSGARKPSGPQPPQMPPELALPERSSQMQSTPPRQEQTRPSASQPKPPAPRPSPPRPSRQARRAPTTAPAPPQPRETPRPRSQTRTSPPAPRKSPQPVQPTPDDADDERRFRITKQQELAMIQRQRQGAGQERQQTMQEHFARLEQRLPLPSFDAPGVYEKGPERSGEGREAQGGGKFRSIDSFGIKHFSYLVGVKRQIELLFDVPYFLPDRGRVGVPIVGFTIRRNGDLAEAVLLRSSGYTVLDRALLDAVRRAAPYGPFPNHLQDQEISIRVYATVS